MESQEALNLPSIHRFEPQVMQQWRAIHLVEEYETLLTELDVQSSIDGENGRVLALEVDDMFIQELEEGTICVTIGEPPEGTRAICNSYMAECP